MPSKFMTSWLPSAVTLRRCCDPSFIVAYLLWLTKPLLMVRGILSWYSRMVIY